MLEDTSDRELLLIINGKVEDHSQQLADLYVYAQKLDAENDLIRSSLKVRATITSALVGVLAAVTVGILISVNYEYQSEKTKFHIGFDSDALVKLGGGLFSVATTSIPLAIAVYLKLKRDPLKVDRVLTDEDKESN
jgi:hypothetical protein